MTRAAWNDLAYSLARVRTTLLKHAAKEHRAAHLERVIGLEIAARAICRTLRARSTRFDSRRFMKIVGTPTK